MLDAEGLYALPGISIHALREEGDAACVHRGRRPSDFYPRPPRGGRPNEYIFLNSTDKFLSTPSARRATRCII